MYQIIVPKQTNKGQSIPTEFLNGISAELQKYFFGVTEMESRGCYLSTKSHRYECEPSKVMFAVRINDDKSSREACAQWEKDANFLDELSSRTAFGFGQESVLAFSWPLHAALIPGAKMDSPNPLILGLTVPYVK